MEQKTKKYMGIDKLP